LKKKKYSRVYVEITNKCNLSCSFCPGTKRAPREMTMEQFAAVCDGVKNLTDYLYFHVMGEPLTHPRITEFITYAAEQGFKPCITTNGTLLPKMGESIVKAGIHKVSISVHSFEEGTVEEQKAYVRQCLEFADYASKAGVLVVLRLWNRGHDEGRNLDTMQFVRDFFCGEEWKEGGRGIRIRHKLHLEFDDRFSWPDMEAETCGNDVFCYGLKDHFGILCDGTIIPCCLDHEGDIALGNAFSENVEEVLGGWRALAMRDGFMKRQATEELCKRCGYAAKKFG